MQIYPAELVKAYRNFKALDSADPLAIVRYYERHEDQLTALDQEQSFDCLATYADALFDAELYKKHLVMANYLLEVIIIENFITFRGEDIYQHTLLRKACSHVHMGNKEKAQDILEQLIRINPENKAARHVLATLLLQEQPVWYRRWTNFYIAFILAASCCLAVSAIFHLANRSESGTKIFFVGLFFLGVSLVSMASTRAYHTWKSMAYTRRLARNLLRLKRKTQIF